MKIFLILHIAIPCAVNAGGTTENTRRSVTEVSEFNSQTYRTNRGDFTDLFHETTKYWEALVGQGAFEESMGDNSGTDLLFPTFQPATLSPTQRPSLPPNFRRPLEARSSSPTEELLLTPSSVPSKTVSKAPSKVPSESPSKMFSQMPSYVPSLSPSAVLSQVPTKLPSLEPSTVPSDLPSDIPSDIPSEIPSEIPSDMPSEVPSDKPSEIPSDIPSKIPTAIPTAIPIDISSLTPTFLPTDKASSSPMASPIVFHGSSRSPSPKPIFASSLTPSLVPTDQPSSSPMTSPIIFHGNSVFPSPYPTISSSLTSSVLTFNPLTSSPMASPIIFHGPSSAPVPPPSPMMLTDCIINVSTFCETIGGLVCNNIPEVDTRCNDTPTRLRVRFNGGDCAESRNFQTKNIFACVDYNGSPSMDIGSEAFIVVNDAKGKNIMYYEGYLNVGEIFDITNNGNELEEILNVTIYSSHGKSSLDILQTMVFHSSCLEDLFLKDTFGSIQLVEFENQNQGVVSSFVDALLAFHILNEGEPVINLASLLSESNIFETFNLTSKVKNELIPSGENLILAQPFQIDITSRREYAFNTKVIGTSGPSFECEYDDFLTFEAGNFVEYLYPTSSPTFAPPVASDIPQPKNPEDTECKLKADIGCRVNGQNFHDCQTLISPIGVQCMQEDEPSNIMFMYTGGDCALSDNSQSNFECEDMIQLPNSVETVFVTVNGSNGYAVRLGEVYRYEGTPGESNGTIEVLISDLNHTSGMAGSLIQRLRIVTDCSEDTLVVTKRFGALQLVGFENESQGLVSIFADLTMEYSIKSEGPTSANATSIIINSPVSGNVSYLNRPLLIDSGDRITFSEDARINLVESLSFTFAFELNAQGSTMYGVPCNVTAGKYNISIA